jgi:hypothetical protein
MFKENWGVFVLAIFVALSLAIIPSLNLTGYVTGSVIKDGELFLNQEFDQTTYLNLEEHNLTNIVSIYSSGLGEVSFLKITAITENNSYELINFEFENQTELTLQNICENECEINNEKILGLNIELNGSLFLEKINYNYAESIIANETQSNQINESEQEEPVVEEEQSQEEEEFVFTTQEITTQSMSEQNITECGTLSTKQIPYITCKIM